VADLMNPDVLSMRPDANIAILTHRLRAYGDLRVMPIADRGHLHGVVTRSDLLRPKKKPGALSRVVGRFQPHRHDDDPLAAARRAPRRGPVDWSHEVTVREVMTPAPLVTVTAATSTEEAVEILMANRFTALPVVGAGDVLVGIVSEADLLRDPLDGRQTTRSRTVGGAMTRQVTTVTPATPISELLADIVDLGLRVVPVVEDKRLVGVVSRSDLL
jgi:CBS domain-containing protein